MDTRLRRLSGKTPLTSGQRLKVVVTLMLALFWAGLFGLDPTSHWSTATATRGFAANAMSDGTVAHQEFAPVASDIGADKAERRPRNPVTVHSGNARAPLQTVESRVTLNGTVYGDTGETLAGRAVVLSHLPTRQKYTTTTNNQGHYSFSFNEPPAYYHLMVFGGADHTDYQQALKMPAVTAELNIFLEPYEFRPFSSRSSSR